ncbi:MAG: type II toxin-antitoxin system RelE/ParE family toxin [Melioribacteraceae bacterium]
MNFELLYTKRAVRDIQKLNERTKTRIKIALEIYSENPYKYLEKLTNFSYGNYRFRIGDYRVIFDIDENRIVILRVGHRKEVYKGK